MPDGGSRLTAIINFSLPHGKNWFHPPDGDSRLTAIFLRPYNRAPSRRYSFGLTAVPHHGDIPSALQPRPITAIFLRPYSRAPSMAIFYSALQPCLTAIVDFSLPLGKNRFHSALWRFTSHGDNQFCLCLTARIDFIPPYGDLRHTALSIFSSPHGNNRFFLCSKENSSYNPSGHFMRGSFSFLLYPF